MCVQQLPLSEGVHPRKGVRAKGHVRPSQKNTHAHKHNTVPVNFEMDVEMWYCLYFADGYFGVSERASKYFHNDTRGTAKKNTLLLETIFKIEKSTDYFSEIQTNIYS